jgi:hypothetical protein
MQDCIKQVLSQIETREALVHKELAKEELAISSKITSETMKTGFDRTVNALVFTIIARAKMVWVDSYGLSCCCRCGRGKEWGPQQKDGKGH